MKKIIGATGRVFSTLSFVIGTAWSFNRFFLLSRFLLAILSGIMPTATVLFSKLIVEQITDGDWKMTVTYIILSFAVTYALTAVILLIQLLQGANDSLFRNDLFFRVLVKNSKLDLALLDSPEISTKKQMATASAQGNYITALFSSFFNLISGAITLLSVTYILSAVDVYILIIMLVVIALQTLIIVLSNRKNRKKFADEAPLNKEVTYYMNVLDDPSCAFELKLHGLADWIASKYYRLILRFDKLVRRFGRSLFRYNAGNCFLSQAQNAVMYLFLAWRMIFAGLSFADFTMFFAALQTFSGTVSSLIGEVIGIGDKCKYVDAYRDYMEIENSIAVPHDDDIRLKKSDVRGSIEFKNVSFCYPGSDTCVLRDLNLSLETGKFYVIVGVNGAGKSTFINLMMRLYDVSSGEITLGGSNIKQYNYEDYRGIFGTVFQNYRSFEFTIAENVALNEFEDTDECRAEVEYRLGEAGLIEKINSLPHRTMTMLGKLFDAEGTRLSGGELQKLALAKALYRDPKIVILDEPTSALDAFAEDDLIQTFGKAARGKTVFYISHRLSVAKYADKVIFIDGNTVSGFDSHERLMQTNRRYAEMYEAQAKHYT